MQTKADIPLPLKANVLVKIKLGKLKSMKILVRMEWNLVVDSIDATSKVQGDKILNPPTDFKYKKLFDKLYYKIGIEENVRTYLCHYADDGKGMP